MVYSFILWYSCKEKWNILLVSGYFPWVIDNFNFCWSHKWKNHCLSIFIKLVLYWISNKHKIWHVKITSSLSGTHWGIFIDLLCVSWIPTSKANLCRWSQFFCHFCWMSHHLSFFTAFLKQLWNSAKYSEMLSKFFEKCMGRFQDIYFILTV